MSTHEFDDNDDRAPAEPDQGAGAAADEAAQVDDGVAPAFSSHQARFRRVQPSEPIDDNASLGPGDIPPPQAKGSGWGEETQVPIQEQPLISPEEAAAAAQDDRPGRRQNRDGGKGKYDEDTVANLDNIADLEEEGQEDLSAKVADAPHAHNQRVQTLDELDQAVFANYAGSSEGIDLSLLMRVLAPREKVDVSREPDVVWEYDQLFTQVSSDMQTELDEGDENDDKEEEEREKTGFELKDAMG